MMRGYRKMIIAILLIGVTVGIELNEHQARVLIAITVSVLGSNVLVHYKDTIIEKVSGRRKRSGGSDTGAAD